MPKFTIEVEQSEIDKIKNYLTSLWVSSEDEPEAILEFNGYTITMEATECCVEAEIETPTGRKLIAQNIEQSIVNDMILEKLIQDIVSNPIESIMYALATSREG